MFCHKCGSVLPDSAAYCQACGTKVPDDVQNMAGAKGGAEPQATSHGVLKKVGKAKVLVAVAIVLLVALTLKSWTVSPQAPDENSRVRSAATQLLKESLASPSSFKEIRTSILWRRNLQDGQGYVAAIDYDAQNGFGAVLRGCSYVSFVIVGDEVRWRKGTYVLECAGTSKDALNQQDVIESIARLNFDLKEDVEASTPPASAAKTGKKVDVTGADAIKLIATLMDSRGEYKWSRPECRDYLIEAQESDHIDVAVHEKHGGDCLGDAETSPAIDRFRVTGQSDPILIFDLVKDAYVKVGQATHRK